MLDGIVLSPLVLLGVFIVLCGVFIFVWWIFFIGKSYLLQKIKANLFFYKNKGAWVTYTKRDGRYFLFYVLIKRNKQVKIMGEKQQLGNSENTLIDIVNETIINQEGKFVATKNFYQGEPVYHLVEGSPTNILIRGRDYEQDISKLKDIIKNISEFDESTDPKIVYKFKQNLNQALTNLYIKEFKYLPTAKKIVGLLLGLEIKIKEERDDEGNLKYPEMPDYQLLHSYIPYLQELVKTLSIKDKTIVNYDELFSSGQLSQIFNESAKMNYIAGVMKNLNFKNFDKIMWIIIIIAIIGFVAIGYMVNNLDGRFDELNTNINNLLAKIEEVTIPPQIQPTDPQNIEGLPNFPAGGS